MENVTTQKLRWKDDWDAAGIGVHDVAIASQSLVVDNLEGAILQRAEKARLKVCIAPLVGDSPFDGKIFEATGGDLHCGPDFLCVYARFILILMIKIRFFEWMIRDLTADEEILLRSYVRKHLVKKG